MEIELINIKMTTEEANALANLIDVAVRSGGVRVAGDALFFISKIELAVKEAKTEEVKE